MSRTPYNYPFQISSQSIQLKKKRPTLVDAYFQVHGIREFSKFLIVWSHFILHLHVRICTLAHSLPSHLHLKNLPKVICVILMVLWESQQSRFDRKWVERETGNEKGKRRQQKVLARLKSGKKRTGSWSAPQTSKPPEGTVWDLVIFTSVTCSLFHLV